MTVSLTSIDRMLIDIDRALETPIEFPLDGVGAKVGTVCTGCDTDRNSAIHCSLRRYRYYEAHASECWADLCKQEAGRCPVGLCDEHHETVCAPGV